MVALQNDAGTQDGGGDTHGGDHEQHDDDEHVMHEGASTNYAEDQKDASCGKREPFMQMN